MGFNPKLGYCSKLPQVRLNLGLKHGRKAGFVEGPLCSPPQPIGQVHNPPFA